MTVNKSDLVEGLAKKMTNMSYKDVALIVDTIFDSMTQSLAGGDRIEIRGFGSFEIRTRIARMARNPKSGQRVHVDKRKVPFFRVGKELKKRVNQG